MQRACPTCSPVTWMSCPPFLADSSANATQGPGKFLNLQIEMIACNSSVTRLSMKVGSSAARAGVSGAAAPKSVRSKSALAALAALARLSCRLKFRPECCAIPWQTSGKYLTSSSPNCATPENFWTPRKPPESPKTPGKTASPGRGRPLWNPPAPSCRYLLGEPPESRNAFPTEGCRRGESKVGLAVRAKFPTNFDRCSSRGGRGDKLNEIK